MPTGVVVGALPPGAWLTAGAQARGTGWPARWDAALRLAIGHPGGGVGQHGGRGVGG